MHWLFLPPCVLLSVYGEGEEFYRRLRHLLMREHNTPIPFSLKICGKA